MGRNSLHSCGVRIKESPTASHDAAGLSVPIGLSTLLTELICFRKSKNNINVDEAT